MALAWYATFLFTLAAIPIHARTFNATFDGQQFTGAINEVDTNRNAITAPASGEHIDFKSTYSISLDKSKTDGTIIQFYLASVINDTHFYIIDTKDGRISDLGSSIAAVPDDTSRYTWLVPNVPPGRYVLLPINDKDKYGISPVFWLGSTGDQVSTVTTATVVATTTASTTNDREGDPGKTVTDTTTLAFTTTRSSSLTTAAPLTSTPLSSGPVKTPFSTFSDAGSSTASTSSTTSSPSASTPPKSSGGMYIGQTGRIVMGVMGTLMGVLGAALGFVLWRRRQRKKATLGNYQPAADAEWTSQETVHNTHVSMPYTAELDTLDRERKIGHPDKATEQYTPQSKAELHTPATLSELHTPQTVSELHSSTPVSEHPVMEHPDAGEESPTLGIFGAMRQDCTREHRLDEIYELPGE